MKIVQMKKFINCTEAEINNFLMSIPAEDIVSVSFHVHAFEGQADEWASVFYKTEEESQ